MRFRKVQLVLWWGVVVPRGKVRWQLLYTGVGTAIKTAETIAGTI